MKIIVTTSNNYLHLLGPFTYLFNRYWDATQLVTIVGYAKPKYELPVNFSFHSMGKQGPVNEWSTDLRKYFESIEDEWFIWLMEDTLIKKVVHEEIEKLKKYTLYKVGRIDLTSEMLNRLHYPFEHGSSIIDNIKCAWHNTEYRLSTQPSIWNKAYLLGYLTPGLNPWQFETQDVDNKWLILAQGVKAVFHNEGVRKSDPHKLDLNGFGEEDVKMINSLL